MTEVRAMAANGSKQERGMGWETTLEYHQQTTSPPDENPPNQPRPTISLTLLPRPVLSDVLVESYIHTPATTTRQWQPVLVVRPTRFKTSVGPRPASASPRAALGARNAPCRQQSGNTMTLLDGHAVACILSHASPTPMMKCSMAWQGRAWQHQSHDNRLFPAYLWPCSVARVHVCPWQR